MNTQSVKFIIIVLLCVVITSCKWYVRGECNVPGPCKVEGGVEGTMQAKLMRELRPITEMLAQSMGFTYEDWVALDPSDFAFTVQGSYATSTSASVTVMSGNQSIGSSTFALNNVGGTYTFANPNSVKSWSQQFTDLADSIKVELMVAQTDTFSTSIKENGISRATYTHAPPNQDPGDDKMIE
ncbi:MAG: hypothetical protein HLX50_13615 [Alteromonadaceae bacterium]|nr:hypothetical protein [Alteromonadaceae bacterium]